MDIRDLNYKNHNIFFLEFLVNSLVNTFYGNYATLFTA